MFYFSSNKILKFPFIILILWYLGYVLNEEIRQRVKKPTSTSTIYSRKNFRLDAAFREIKYFKISLQMKIYFIKN